MGNTCKPMAVSFQCMTKSTTIKKKRKKEREPERVESDPYSLLNMAPKERCSSGPWKKLQDALVRAGI